MNKILYARIPLSWLEVLVATSTADYLIRGATERAMVQTVLVALMIWARVVDEKSKP